MAKQKLKKNGKSNSQPTGSKPYASTPKPWVVVNNGQDIVLPLTTFWDSDFARKGGLYLTFNNGAARLLVPDAHIDSVEDMRSGKLAVLTRGAFPGMRLMDCMEILFDDGKDEPFSLHLCPDACNQMLPNSDIGKDFPLQVWTRTAKVATLDAKYRRAQSLPLLTPWTRNELAYASPQEARTFSATFHGEFESRIFPYVIRAANELTGSAAETMKWRSVPPTLATIFVAPVHDGLITAKNGCGSALELSAEAFGRACCIVAYSRISNSPSPLADRCSVLSHFLRESLMSHPERSAIWAMIE